MHVAASWPFSSALLERVASPQIFEGVCVLAQPHACFGQEVEGPLRLLLGGAYLLEIFPFGGLSISLV